MKGGNPIGPIYSLSGRQHGASISMATNPQETQNEFLKTEATCAKVLIMVGTSIQPGHQILQRI
jgi:hypothetical protein